MIELHPLDHVWIRVVAPDGILRELSDYFTFETPGANYMRRHSRFKKWDGRIRLFKLKTQTIYRGLTERVVEFCEQRGYEVSSHVPKASPHVRHDDLDAFLSTLELPHDVRDYQHAATQEMLRRGRGIVLSPTGSGKSLIIYMLYRALACKRTLLVVPSIGLVSQMVKDFQSYGYDTSDVHTIHAGREKESDAGLFVSTWQSIYQQSPEYFSQFDCIIVDEVHGAKSKSLTHLLEQARETPYRFGFTGTLDDLQAHQLILEGLFGSVYSAATTHQLIKRKELTPLRVNMVVLKYPDTACKNVKKIAKQYPDEIDFIVGDPARLEFTAQLVNSLKGNVLLLFAYKGKHGIPLFERIKACCPGKDVHYIAGEVEGDERESIRQYATENDGNQVIVASYGTFSTGINLPNLKHLVLASPSKSKIRVLQSVGRTLRLHEGKVRATLWDIVDDLRTGKHVNHVMRHAEERARFYAAQKFPVTIKEVSLESFSRYLAG